MNCNLKRKFEFGIQATISGTMLDLYILLTSVLVNVIWSHLGQPVTKKLLYIVVFYIDFESVLLHIEII